LIRVDSQPGLGTTFRLYFAVHEGESRETPKPLVSEARVPAAAAEGGCELILLAEDDNLVRRATASILQRRGYEVLMAADGEEAWNLFQQRRSEIALVILDVVMPRAGGNDVAVRIHAAAPQLPVLL